jgi:hypothetical protein
VPARPQVPFELLFPGLSIMRSPGGVLPFRHLATQQPSPAGAPDAACSEAGLSAAPAPTPWPKARAPPSPARLALSAIEQWQAGVPHSAMAPTPAPFEAALLCDPAWGAADRAALAGKRGALARDWRTAVQQRRWAPLEARRHAVDSLAWHSPALQSAGKARRLRRKHAHVRVLAAPRACMDLDHGLASELGLLPAAAAAAAAASSAPAPAAPAGGGEPAARAPPARPHTFLLLPYADLARIPPALAGPSARPGAAVSLIFCPDEAVRSPPRRPAAPPPRRPAAPPLRRSAHARAEPLQVKPICRAMRALAPRADADPAAAARASEDASSRDAVPTPALAARAPG